MKSIREKGFEGVWRREYEGKKRDAKEVGETPPSLKEEEEGREVRDDGVVSGKKKPEARAD